MSVEKIKRTGGETVWRVRWRQGGRNRARTFSTRRDALDYDAELRRSKRLHGLENLDAGTETLGEYVIKAWAPTHAPLLSETTRRHYAGLYDSHLRDHLGDIPLRELSPAAIARWQSDRLTEGAGPIAVSQTLKLLGSILEQALRDERVTSNAARRVRRPRQPRREEVRPLSPDSVELMRVAMPQRDATLISVLAYAGLRPGEALALTWGDIRERTLLVQRAVSLGEISDTKTGHHRTVRLLGPLASDLREWQLANGRPPDSELIFPSHAGKPWTLPAYQSWRRRAFDRAVRAAGMEHARPYDLRHSFASLLLHEGRSVIYVARQLGHDARLTLTRYGHVIDELEDQPRLDAEAAIRAARESCGTRLVPATAGGE